MGDSDDIYSDVDSDGFVQDMRSYGVAQALPLEVSQSIFITQCPARLITGGNKYWCFQCTSECVYSVQS